MLPEDAHVKASVNAITKTLGTSFTHLSTLHTTTDLLEVFCLTTGLLFCDLQWVFAHDQPPRDPVPLPPHLVSTKFQVIHFNACIKMIDLVANGVPIMDEVQRINPIPPAPVPPIAPKKLKKNSVAKPRQSSPVIAPLPLDQGPSDKGGHRRSNRESVPTYKVVASSSQNLPAGRRPAKSTATPTVAPSSSDDMMVDKSPAKKTKGKGKTRARG